MEKGVKKIDDTPKKYNTLSILALVFTILFLPIGLFFRNNGSFSNKEK